MNKLRFKDLDSIEDIKIFFEDNKKLLTYLQKYEGLDNFLGSGTKGRVWKLKGKELTLKITSDLDEIQISKILSNKNTEGFIQIYDYIEIEKYLLKVQQMCYPIEKTNNVAFYTHLFYELYKTTDYNLFLEKYGSMVKDSKSEIMNHLDLFSKVYRDCEKLGILNQYEYLDINRDNIMIDKNQNYRLVDF